MIVTPFGLIVFVIGVFLLLRGSATAMLVFVLACTLFGGAATFILPALGGSSILPAMMGAIFLVVHTLLHQSFERIAEACAENCYLLAFALYAAVTAFILPRMFQDLLYVVPMKAVGLATFETAPLGFTNQNITHAINIVTMMLAGICAYLVVSNKKNSLKILKACLLIGLIHAGFGALDLALTSINQQWILDIFRNGSYSQTDQVVGAFTRINGVFPESSAYSAYAFFWFVLATEAWLRNLVPFRSGLTALALLAVMMFTTSSTAYVGLAAYMAMFVIRFLVAPRSVSPRKAVTIFLVAVTLGAGAVALMIYSPAFYADFAGVVEQMTFGKARSESGVERQMWARQGWEAFKASYGLGIGAGSFRSSSLAAAVLGSVGAFGAAALVLHILRVTKPLRRSTYMAVASEPLNIGSAFAWAAVVGLLPAVASSPSPDPGPVFAIFAGISLACRRQTVRARLKGAPAAAGPVAPAGKPAGAGR